MKLLDKYIPLKSKITVYVPATINVDEETDNGYQVDRVARALSDCFGGATATPAQGFWVSDGGDLVRENTVMVFAYCTTEDAERYIADIVRLCVALRHEMTQEAIALEYNGDMYFV